MAKSTKHTLKEARDKGKLGEFVKEHEKDVGGDEDRLDAILKSAF